MSKIRTLLVPTDFSEPSSHALGVAIDLAAQIGARLELLHCYELGIQWSAVYEVAFPEELWDGVRRTAERKIREAIEQAKARGVEAEGHLTTAPPAEAIVDHARRMGADLIVMGMRGQSALRRMLVGSVTDETLRHAPCPVLAVPEKGT